jgi:hypothetical protein
MSGSAHPVSLRYVLASGVVGLVVLGLGALAWVFALGVLDATSADPASDSGAVQGVAFVAGALFVAAVVSVFVLPVLAWLLSVRGGYSGERFLKAVLVCTAAVSCVVALVAAIALGSMVAFIPFSVLLFFAGAVLVGPLTGLWARLAE